MLEVKFTILMSRKYKKLQLKLVHNCALFTLLIKPAE
jgi:hypothetical protein